MTFVKHPSGLLYRTEYASQDLEVINEVWKGDAYWTSLRGTHGHGEIVVDIGAHIGAFARKWHDKNPLATIVCVEACPENIEVLAANVGEWAEVSHAACSYEAGDLALLNSVKADGTATGGSVVVPASNVDRSINHFHWRDTRPLLKVNLESIMESLGVDHIDVLKLDCEGSEFSILGSTPSIDRIGFICGEYHGTVKWNKLRAEIFPPPWQYGHMHAAGDLGIFHYAHPDRIARASDDEL
tara:strand:+ start:7366 stop:8088 length:723 start_codon:yes stop_codon:yes gene_type:complete